MRVLIVTSFLLAFVLMVVPISFQWRWCRPEFVVLLVIYWAMFTPQHFGLGAAWLVGLFQDLLELAPLGLNAMAMMLVAYISHLVYQRIRNYVFWHQALWVFVLIGIFGLFSNWLSSFMGKDVGNPVFLVAALLSSLFWPFLVIIMSRLKVYFRVLQ